MNQRGYKFLINKYERAKVYLQDYLRWNTIYKELIELKPNLIKPSIFQKKIWSERLLKVKGKYRKSYTLDKELESVDLSS